MTYIIIKCPELDYEKQVLHMSQNHEFIWERAKLYCENALSKKGIAKRPKCVITDRKLLSFAVAFKPYKGDHYSFNVTLVAYSE